MSDNVRRLVDVSGIAMSNEEIASWMRQWADHIEHQVDAPIRTLAVVAEDEHGNLAVISAGRPCDRARMVGLLTLAADFVRVEDLDYRSGFLEGK